MINSLLKIKNIFISLLVVLLLLTGCSQSNNNQTTTNEEPYTEQIQEKISLENIPEYDGKHAYVEINGNVPFFTDEEKSISDTFEEYSPLDELGRCGEAFALVTPELMPTEERGSIGMIKPTGWHTIRYDFVDGKYLYNRCHLIGYQLTGENANELNLITGTRYLNIEGMLPFENMVADYVKETGNGVLYRSTPIFEGDNLLASGVLLEGYSVADNGESIMFNVYAYNVQPGVDIDYRTGDNKESAPQESEPSDTDKEYILNTNSKKFHDPDCSGVDDMSSKNKEDYYGSREELINMGYEPCSRCNP